MTVVIKFPRVQHHEEPDEDIIEVLAELFDKAKSGDLQSLVALSIGNGPPELSMKMDKGHAASLIGGLHVACSKIARMLDGVLEEQANASHDEEEP